MLNTTEIKTLGQVYNNFERLIAENDGRIELSFPDPEFSQFLDQIKAAKGLVINTNSLEEFTTDYKPKSKKDKLVIKVTCVGNRKINVRI